MNKEEILHLNVLPEGRAAWLNYDQYVTLKQLFETVPVPAVNELDAESQQVNDSYRLLHNFLTEQAGLAVPMSESAIHFNAFALLRRGYQIEAITPNEYRDLKQLMQGLEQPDIGDMDLYDTGGHRTLYDYLTQQMGISVQAGRGPAWHRANVLLDQYQSEHSFTRT